MSPRPESRTPEHRAHDYRGAFTAAGARTRTRRETPQVPAEPGLVVEDPASGFCGAVGRSTPAR